MKWAKQTQEEGFTIVELLIVVVVIAILAAITIVGFTGIQERARNSQRVTDMSSITKALELYKLKTGSYPVAQGNVLGGWESSAVNPDNFLSALRTSGVVNKVPVDPINFAPNGANTDAGLTTSYLYYRYPSGYGGCPAARGEFYVLVADPTNTARASSAPGVTCGSNNWNFGYWSGGGFTNG